MPRITRIESRLLRLAAIALVLNAGAIGGECLDAVLRNGFTVENVRTEGAGGVTRLWLCAGGGSSFVEVPSGEIARFEPRPPAIAPMPVATAAASVEKAEAGPAPTKDSIRSLITSTALRYRIDPDFVASVVKAESGYDPAAVSPKGARGLMQLMPVTAAELGVADVFDPVANLEGGTKYLRQLLDQFSGNAAKALSAYNAGPQSVAAYGGIPPYAETRAYVARIIHDYNLKKSRQSASPPAAAGVN